MNSAKVRLLTVFVICLAGKNLHATNPVPDISQILKRPPNVFSGRLTPQQSAWRDQVMGSGFAANAARKTNGKPAAKIGNSPKSGGPVKPNFSKYPAINLVQDAQPVQQQGRLSDCTAFAFTAAFEMVLKHFYQTNIKLSEAQFWMRYRVGNIVDAAIAVTSGYDVPEYAWPYLLNPNVSAQAEEDYTAPPGFNLATQAVAIATSINTPGGTPIDWIPAVIQLLGQGFPVTLGIYLNNSFIALKADSGPIAISAQDPPQPNEGHDVVIIGFFPDKNEPYGGYWIIRNSWGTNWGLGGYALLPLSYGLDYSLTGPDGSLVSAYLEPVAITSANVLPRASLPPNANVQGWVATTFENILNRLPSIATPELSNWEGAVYADRDLGGVAGMILRTPEYQTDEIIGNYETILKALPSSVMIINGVSALQENHYIEEFQVFLVSSKSYAAQTGYTDEGFIAGLYRDLLHRTAPPAPWEVSSWVAKWRKGSHEVPSPAFS